MKNTLLFKNYLKAILLFAVFAISQSGMAQVLLPYFENFSSITAGNGFPTVTGGAWTRSGTTTNQPTYITNQTLYNRTGNGDTKFITFRYDSGTRYYFVGPFNLTAGSNYKPSILYKADGLTGFGPLQLTYGTTAAAATHTNTVATIPANIVNSTFSTLTGNFSPTTTGNYFIGIKCTADGNPWYLTVDDFSMSVLSACSGTPTPGNTITSNSNACNGTTANLTLQNATSGSGVTYQWQSSSAVGGPYSDISGATSSNYTATISATTYFQANVTCSGNTGTSTPVSVTLNPFTSCYPVNYASNAGDEDISNVTVGSLNNTSNNCTVAASGTGSIAGRYSNFTTTVAAPALVQSATVPFSLTMTSCSTGSYGNFFQIYIDYNADGDYLDAGEQVYSQPTSVTANTQTITGTFVVPAGATVGTTGMRVVNVETTAGTTNYATNAYSYGETEDYIVNIVAPSTATPDYANLQFPATATILAGESATVYGQVFEAGLTDVEPGYSGQAAGIQAWVGISPIGSNSNPNTWTTWIPATHNASFVGNNDEYKANIGSTLLAGTYYYATRYSLSFGPYVYGGTDGTNGNFWDGTTYNSGVLTVNANPTQCATNPTPIDTATNIPNGPVVFSWNAPTSGPTPTSYEFYGGTTSGSLALVTTVTTTTATITITGYSTLFYWKIVPISTVGGSATGCPEWSFTTQADPFAPYCSSVSYTNGVEPITKVTFAGIDNSSSNVLGGTPSLENFIAVTGNVEAGNTYTMTLKGNTDGAYTSYFSVYIDYNRDNDFDDAGESFTAGSINNSTGLDAVSAVTNITIPYTASAGSTRMRIKKIFSDSTLGGCTGGGFGQSEDYTLNITNNVTLWTITSPATTPAWTNGVPTATVNALIDADYSEIADVTAKNLSINTGKVLNVNPTNSLNVAGNLTNNGSIIFKSDATGTGRFAQYNGAVVAGTGTATVERYISGRRAFRFLTPGVTTTTTIRANWQNAGLSTAGIGTQITGSATGANGFDQTGSGNPSLATYNAQIASGTGFVNAANTNVATLKAGVGYRLLVRGDRTLDLSLPSTDNMNNATTLSSKGTLKTGTVTFDSSAGSPAPVNNVAGNTQTNGYTLIGNPYVSPVDWDAVVKTGVKNNAYYTWDPTLGTAAQRGRYVVYSSDSGLTNLYGDVTTNSVTSRRYLQTGQAVFIKNTDLAVPATLTFNEANKASTNAYVFKNNQQSATATGNSSLYLTVYDSNELAIGAAPIDGSVALFGTAYNNALDANDVDKLTTSGENLAFVRENKNLAIETLAPVVANDELFVKTVQFQAGKNYTFKVNTANFDTAVTAKMVDLYLNTETAIDLTQPSFVTFATTADANSYGSDRFKIVFNNAALGNGSFNASAVAIYPNPIANNEFTIALPNSVSGNVTVKMSNMLGQEVYSRTAEATTTMQIQPKQQLEEGVYVVSISNNGKVIQAKVIVKN